MDIGKRVRDAREARGMTQEELARRAGVPLNRVGRIETGTVTDPHYSTLSRIAGGLDVSVGELLEEPVPLGERETGPEITFPLDLDQIRREVAGDNWAESLSTRELKKAVEEELARRYSRSEELIFLKDQFKELVETLSPYKDERFDEFAKAVEGFGYVSRVLVRTAGPQLA